MLRKTKKERKKCKDNVVTWYIARIICRLSSLPPHFLKQNKRTKTKKQELCEEKIMERGNYIYNKARITLPLNSHEK